MIKRLTFALVMATLVVSLASAHNANSSPTPLADTMTYYLNGKVISSERFLKLDSKALVSIDVDKGAKTVKGYTTDSPSVEPRSYQSKGTKIDWSAAKVLQDVSFVVDDKVTDSQKARSIDSEQIESVYQMPASATGPNGDVGSFGKNGVVVITTKKK